MDVVALTSLVFRPFREVRSRHARLLQHSGDYGRILDFEFALPEALEHAIDVGLEPVVILGSKHADMGDGAVKDLLRAAHCQSNLVREPPGIHVAVAHTTPLVLVTGFYRAQEIRDFQGVRLPNRVDAEFGCQRPRRSNGQVGVRTLDVDVDGEHGQ